MSAESGIPTFRDAQNGLWAQIDPEDLATVRAYQQDKASVWGWYVWRMSMVGAALPEERGLRTLAVQTGLLGIRSIGLAVGYGIFIHKDHKAARLVAHELRHVHQYEKAGAIAVFLPNYLQQILDHGYAQAPLEIDARGYELVGVSDTPAR